jgi:hypothetical protein
MWCWFKETGSRAVFPWGTASAADLANLCEQTNASTSVPAGFASYSFVLQNQTPKAIVAIGVRWTCVDAQGHVRTHDRVWSNMRLSSGGLIRPGLKQAVTPVLNLKAALQSGTLAQEMRPFIGQQSVSVSLEAVILGDGTAFGPDANNTIPRVQARTDAERALLTGAVKAWQQSGAAEMSSYLQALVSSAPPQNGDPAIIHTASPAAAYAMALSDWRTRLAKQFLRMATNDAAGFASFAQQRLATTDYPNIHR